uniref:Vitamin D receptor n=1 Tax=Halocynthia roretzi TaxID=7729 RepID=A0A191UPZ3_HALRO|nr:vitamin D receptor [Halocynthia roretzi]
MKTVGRTGVSLSRLRQDSPEDEGKTKDKICVVCGDIATGTHFAAMTCEGCKGFFRRSMKKCTQFTCAFENHCTINKSNRKHCQACRLQKCLAVGMNSNLIMSEESVNRKRELIRTNREKRALMRLKKEQEEIDQREKIFELSPQPIVQMTPEDKCLIKMLLDCHYSSYDFSYEDYETFRGRQHIAPPNVEEIKTSHVTLAWLMANTEEDLSRPQEEKPRKSASKVRSSSKKDNKVEHPKRAKDEGVCSSSNNSPVECCDLSDTFGSLHGVSQPPVVQQDGAVGRQSVAQDSFYSDSSASMPSRHNIRLGDQELNQYKCDMADQAATRMMFEDSKDTLADSGVDSLLYLQGLFMNQGLMDEKMHSLFQHFCDIMTWGIKKVIEFCKCIPEFQELSTVDQINLLRGGCLEMLVLRSYFAFASDGNKYMSDKFQYSPEDFLQAGASTEFVDQYTNVHMRMRKMKLKVEEICLLIGLVLFSPDRPGVQDHGKVEAMQKRIAQALRAYEYTNKDPEKACVIYSELLLLLPVLRTINVLFSNTILTLKDDINEDDINPLILEVNN